MNQAEEGTGSDRYVPILWWVQNMGQTAELRNLRHVALVVAPDHYRTRSALVSFWRLFVEALRARPKSTQGTTSESNQIKRQP